MSSVLQVVGLLLIGIGIAAAGYGYRRKRQRAAIASVETTDALRVTPGPAEVSGTAEPADDGAMRAPFTDESCLLAEWEIEEWEESGKHASWRRVGSGTLTVPFYVGDDTGQVLVRPGGAAVELSGDRETTEVGVEETPPEPIREFTELESTPGDPDGALVGALDWGTQVGDRRYHQRVLRPGEAVYVHGTATRVESERFGGDDFEIVAGADDGHPDSDVFLVADSTESALLARRRDWLLYVGAGAVLAFVGVGLAVSPLL